MTLRYILGVDGSRLSTGFALLREDDIIVQSGAWTLYVPPKRGRKTIPDEDPDDPGVAWARLHAHLDALRETFPTIVAVAYEVPTFGGSAQSFEAISSTVGAMAVIELWAELAGLPYHGFAATTLKRFAAGNGHAEKTEVIAAARARWGTTCITSARTRQQGDEADAMWLAAMGREWLDDPADPLRERDLDDFCGDPT